MSRSIPCVDGAPAKRPQNAFAAASLELRCPSGDLLVAQ